MSPSSLDSTHICVLGQSFDINDDNGICAALRADAELIVGPIPAPIAKDALLDLLVDARLATVKLGFVIDRAARGGHGGIGLETLVAFYNQLLNISELAIEHTPVEADPPALEGDQLPGSKIITDEL